MAKNVGLLDVDGVAYQIAENGLATKAADGFYTGVCIQLPFSSASR